MKPNFFSKTFFSENVAKDPAQLLAKTWCPYLFWVLRNLPHKFEKLAHVTKSAKKNVAKLVPQKENSDHIIVEETTVNFTTNSARSNVDVSETSFEITD